MLFRSVVQTHLQRVLGQDYMTTQDQLQLFYILRLGSGVVVVIGALMWIWSVFGPVKAEIIDRNGTPAAAE